MTKIQMLPVQAQNSRALREGEIFISEIRGRYLVCRWENNGSTELEPYIEFDSEAEARAAASQRPDFDR